ncbi:serine hydrolase domain-containing protein [Gemmatimonas groenlandica]|uniref:Beta-lactamase family protein n=1 Tax=Gemmatimonas groenlandica TaxID=2732249 RepID=A0A6M4IQT5_9BACT|nr:serine hydrolase domain-containing protein [Gemmatimonas groenlandica]QJR35202.1 beta-lactamase family protein [Gemmatimonas groenlandica]
MPRHGLLRPAGHIRAPRATLCIASLAACALTTAVSAQTPARTTTPIAFTRFVDSLARVGFSGSVLLADQRQVLLYRTMGMADRATRRAITPSDRWRYASVSKQITAALVLREVDAKRIVLDVPVSTYLPGFTDGARAEITVRHLLQHTSGLPNLNDGPSDADGTPRAYRERGANVGDAAYARLCSGAPVAAPGSRFEYNNCDYLVLGALLRARTGKTTSQLLARQLGSAWTPGARETVRGYLTDSTSEAPFELATFGSAGALTGTLEGLLAFDRLLLGTMLSPAAKGELWRGEPKLGYAALGAWAFEAGLAGCATPVRLIERRGEIGGIQVRNVLLPERGLVLMMFTNRLDVVFGEVWQGPGLMYDALQAAACAAASP